MRSAVLPFVSPNYDFGNISYEQIFNDTLHNNVPEFCIEAKESDNNDNNNNNQQTVENCSSLFQSSFVTHQLPAHFPSSASILSCDSIDNVFSSHHQTMLLGKKILAPQLEDDFPTMRNTRKRPIEVDHVLPKLGIGELLCDHRSVGFNEPWSRNKRIKVINSGQEWKHQVRETFTGTQQQKLQVPARKSQKLTDKITVLQKLVSPYGKTDTASVLQEASLYIKLLQEQIQNLFRMLSSSCSGVRVLNSQESGKRKLDLRSKGLCLVPVSFTQKVKFEEQIDHKYQRY